MVVKASALTIDALRPKKSDQLQCPNPKAGIGFLVRYISSKLWNIEPNEMSRTYV
jgi:hypothetical protein